MWHESDRDSNEAETPRPRRRGAWAWSCLLAVGMAGFGWGEAANASAVSSPVLNGPPSERYDVAIVSEGYTTAELPTFKAQALAIADALRSTSPFREYWSYVNVHIVELASPRSGIPFENAPERTALGTWLPPGDEMPKGNRRRIRAAARKAPGADAVVVLVNAWFRSVAHTGYTFVSGFDDVGPVAVHELGHVIGRLLDEYEERPSSRWDFTWANVWSEGLLEYSGWGRNVTTHTRRNEIPWRAWIEPGVRVPTPAGREGAVGVYRGAFTLSRRWYRPQATCLMRDEYRPFCPVCREQLVLRLSQRAFPLRVVKEKLDKKTWRFVIRAGAIPGGKRIRWYRNGFPVEEGNTFYATRDDSPWGKSYLECRVEDTTPFVRHDRYDWTTFRVWFSLDKGYAWSRGLRVRGPYREPAAEAGGESTSEDVQHLLGVD